MQHQQLWLYFVSLILWFVSHHKSVYGFVLHCWWRYLSLPVPVTSSWHHLSPPQGHIKQARIPVSRYTDTLSFLPPSLPLSPPHSQLFCPPSPSPLSFSPFPFLSLLPFPPSLLSLPSSPSSSLSPPLFTSLPLPPFNVMTTQCMLKLLCNLAGVAKYMTLKVKCCFDQVVVLAWRFLCIKWVAKAWNSCQDTFLTSFSLVAVYHENGVWCMDTPHSDCHPPHVGHLPWCQYGRIGSDCHPPHVGHLPWCQYGRIGL